MEELRQENKALKSQLGKADRYPTGANGVVSHGVPHAAAEAVAGLQKSSTALQQLLDLLAHTADTADHPHGQANGIMETCDSLVQLSVSGAHMEVPLSVLQQVSMMPGASMPAAVLLLHDHWMTRQGSNCLPTAAFSSAVLILMMQSCLLCHITSCKVLQRVEQVSLQMCWGLSCRTAFLLSWHPCWPTLYQPAPTTACRCRQAGWHRCLKQAASTSR